MFNGIQFPLMLSKNFPISFQLFSCCLKVRKKILPKTMIFPKSCKVEKFGPRAKITKFSNNWGQDNDGRYRTHWSEVYYSALLKFLTLPLWGLSCLLKSVMKSLKSLTDLHVNKITIRSGEKNLWFSKYHRAINLARSQWLIEWCW